MGLMGGELQGLMQEAQEGTQEEEAGEECERWFPLLKKEARRWI